MQEYRATDAHNTSLENYDKFLVWTVDTLRTLYWAQVSLIGAVGALTSFRHKYAILRRVISLIIFSSGLLLTGRLVYSLDVITVSILLSRL